MANPSYFNAGLLLFMPNPDETTLSVGSVIFTQAGQELSSVCTPLKVECVLIRPGRKNWTFLPFKKCVSRVLESSEMSAGA
jgi:hypothetical protein